MALEDKVKAQIATQKLVELTRKDDRGLTTINDTVLTEAANNVRGEFKRHVRVVFDETDAGHVSLGVRGVVIVLKQMSLHPEAPDLFEKWVAALKNARNRISPKSKSPLKIHRDTEVNQDQEVFDLETGLRDIVPGTREGGPDLQHF